MSKKSIIAWVIIGFLMVADFLMIQSVILDSNSTYTVSVLAACLFTAALDIGPTFTGIGVAEIADKTRIWTGFGKKRPIISIIAGGSITFIAFIVYMYIRYDAYSRAASIAETPQYGEIILIFTPLLTSLLAFLIGWLMLSKTGVIQAESDEQKALHEYEEALSAKNEAESDYHNFASTVFRRHFPYEHMPDDPFEVADKIRGKVSSELAHRMSILLPQLLNEANLTSPFCTSIKEVCRECVQDTDYLSAVNLPLFHPDSQIGEAYIRLKERISITIKIIIDSIYQRSVEHEKCA